MKKKKVHIQISLYLLIPFTASGIALIWVLLTERVSLYIHSGGASPWTFSLWVSTVFIVSFLISLAVIRLILEPVIRFIRKAESLPVYPRAPADNDPQSRDAIEHYTQVF